MLSLKHVFKSHISKLASQIVHDIEAGYKLEWKEGSSEITCNDHLSQLEWPHSLIGYIHSMQTDCTALY